MYFIENKKKICKNYLLFALVIAVIEFVLQPIAAACASGFFTSWLLNLIAPFSSVYFWAVMAGAIFAAAMLGGKEFKGIEKAFTIVISFVLISTFVSAFNNIFSTAGNAVRFNRMGFNGANVYDWGGMVTGFFQLAIFIYFVIAAKYFKIFAEQIKEIVSYFKLLKKEKAAKKEAAAATAEEPAPAAPAIAPAASVAVAAPTAEPEIQASAVSEISDISPEKTPSATVEEAAMEITPPETSEKTEEVAASEIPEN